MVDTDPRALAELVQVGREVGALQTAGKIDDNIAEVISFDEIGKGRRRWKGGMCVERSWLSTSEHLRRQ